MKLSAVFRRSHIQPWPASDVCPGEREKFSLVIYPLPIYLETDINSSMHAKLENSKIRANEPGTRKIDTSGADWSESWMLTQVIEKVTS